MHDEPGLLIATCGAIHRSYRERAAKITGQLAGYEPNVEKEWVIVIGREKYAINVLPADGGYEVVCGDMSYQVETDWQFGQPLFRGHINGAEICVQVERRHLSYRLFHWGTQVEAMVLSARAAELLALIPPKESTVSTKYLLSPMPGLLARIVVVAGEEVKAGQDLAVVEAMKMENSLRAERDGKVHRLLAQVGESLAVDQPIIEFE